MIRPGRALHRGEVAGGDDGDTTKRAKWRVEPPTPFYRISIPGKRVPCGPFISLRMTVTSSYLLPKQPSSVPVAVPPVSVVVAHVASSSAVGAVLLPGLVVGLLLARLGGLLLARLGRLLLARLGGPPLLPGLRERVEVVVWLPPPGDVRHRRRRSLAREHGGWGRRGGSRRRESRGGRRRDGGSRRGDGGEGRRGGRRTRRRRASLLGGRYEVLLGNTILYRRTRDGETFRKR